MTLNKRGAVPTASLLLAALSVALVPAPAAVAQGEGGEDEPAEVRMAHLSPDTPKGDIYVDGAPVEELQGVPFGAVSPYLELPPGEKQVEIYAEGDTPETAEPALEADAEFEGGEHYTLAAVGLLEDDTLAAKLYEDDQTPPAEGKAELRVVHAVPDVGPATVSAKGPGEEEETLTLPGFANASPYAELPAGEYALAVTPAGGDEPAFEAEVDLEEGEIRTVFVVGEASEGSLDVVDTLDREGDAAREAAAREAAAREAAAAAEARERAAAEEGGVEVPIEPSGSAFAVSPLREESTFAGDAAHAPQSQYAGSYAYPSEPLRASVDAYGTSPSVAPAAPAPAAAEPAYAPPVAPAPAAPVTAAPVSPAPPAQAAVPPASPLPPVQETTALVPSGSTLPIQDGGGEVPDLAAPTTGTAVDGVVSGGSEAGNLPDGAALPGIIDGQTGNAVQDAQAGDVNGTVQGTADGVNGTASGANDTVGGTVQGPVDGVSDTANGLGGEPAAPDLPLP